jgi:hypothetical protein
MKRNFTLLLVFLSVLLSGCFVNRQPVFNLSPVDNNSKWLMGREYTKKEINDVLVELAFQDQEDNSIYFFVNIFNYSSGEILIDPEEFYVQVIKSEADTSETLKITAADPEKMINSLKNEVEKEKASFQSYSGTSAFVSLLDLVGDIALDSKRTPEEKAEDSWKDEEREMQYERRKYSYEDRISSLHDKRLELEDTAVRKSHLLPGEKISGRVYFPLIRNASLLRLNFSVEKRIFRFIFRQEKV